MLKSISIKNFRSLKEVSELPLKPLNILIGPNTSGKSSLLHSFQLMREYALGGEKNIRKAIYRFGGIRRLCWAHTATEIEIGLHFKLNNNSQRYNLNLNRSGDKVEIESGLQYNTHEAHLSFLREKAGGGAVNYRLPSELSSEEKSEIDVRLRKKRATFKSDFNTYCRSWRFYFPPEVGIDSELRSVPVVENATVLSEDSSNYINVLHTLNTAHKKEYADIMNILKVAYPEFEELEFPPSQDVKGAVEIKWREKPFKKAFDTYMLSDGVLRFLMIALILNSPEKPSLICIDEPEVGLHPALMPIIFDMLKSAAEESQLIVATHSPELVDCFTESTVEEPDKVSVITVEKKDGATSFTPLEGETLKKWLKDFQLGELWKMGEIGGNPW